MAGTPSPEFTVRGCLFVDPRTRHDHETVETKKWYEQRPALQARIGSYRIVYAAIWPARRRGHGHACIALPAEAS